MKAQLQALARPVRPLFPVARRVLDWLRATRVVRTWMRYGDLRGNRLAGAVSFYGFISLFPLLVLAAAVASLVMGPEAVEELQTIVDENVPGLALDVQQFQDRAGTLGLVSVVTLLFTGLGWVDAARAAVRSMWQLDDEPGNLVTRKLLDVAALVGLGLVVVVSALATVVGGAGANLVIDWFALNGTVGHLLLQVVGLGLAVLTSALLFGYLLTGLPRVAVPWQVLVPSALLGGAIFELLKQFVAEYVTGAASRNTYAAFATPLALLAWIYLVTRLLMLLAAWTAEWAEDHRPHPPPAR